MNKTNKTNKKFANKCKKLFNQLKDLTKKMDKKEAIQHMINNTNLSIEELLTALMIGSKIN